MKRKTMILILIMFLLIVNLFCASKNGKLTYNGYIEENGTRVNGDMNLSFKLYDSILGGTSLWESNEYTVVVRHGEYEYTLGENTDLPGDILDRENIYIEVLKDSVVVGVRKKIIKPSYASFSTYASTASYASSVDWSNIENIPAGLGDGDDNTVLWNQSDANLYYSDGNVSIGTNNFDEKLVVAGNIKLSDATGGKLYLYPNTDWYVGMKSGYGLNDQFGVRFGAHSSGITDRAWTFHDTYTNTNTAWIKTLSGDSYFKGTVEASSFKGNGAQLTGINSGQFMAVLTWTGNGQATRDVINSNIGFKPTSAMVYRLNTNLVGGYIEDGSGTAQGRQLLGSYGAAYTGGCEFINNGLRVHHTGGNNSCNVNNESYSAVLFGAPRYSGN